jgi:DNA-binding XRE family transcriptional regulator
VKLKKLHEHLEAYRVSRKMSMRAMAQDLGINPKTYYRIEKGLNSASSKHFVLIMNRLNPTGKDLSLYDPTL